MSDEQIFSRRTRIKQDQRDLQALADACPQLLSVSSRSADYIELNLQLTSLARIDKAVSFSKGWSVRLTFPPDYPGRSGPEIQIISPAIFHPNIRRDGGVPLVILGMEPWGHGEDITLMVARLWDVLRFDQEVEPTLIFNPEASQWIRQHLNTAPTMQETLSDYLPFSQGVPVSTKIDARLTVHARRAKAESAQEQRAGDDAAMDQAIVDGAVPSGPSASAASPSARADRWPDGDDPERQGSAPPPMLMVSDQAAHTATDERQAAPLAPHRAFYPKEIRVYQPTQRPIPPGYPQAERGGDGNGTRIFIHRSVYDAIQSHAAADRSKERFGILVGSVFEDPARRSLWVEISQMIPASQVDASIAHVEVSAEEMGRINATVDAMLESNNTEMRKVGWYHTHPGHGIFMSGTDRTNQELYWKANWHVALVVDPINKKDGVFIGAQSLPATYAIIEDSIVQPEVSRVPPRPFPIPGESVPQPKQVPPPAPVLSPGWLDPRSPYVRFIGLGCVIFASFWAGTLWQRRSNTEAVQQELIAYASRASADRDDLLRFAIDLDPNSAAARNASILLAQVLPTTRPPATLTPTVSQLVTSQSGSTVTTPGRSATPTPTVTMSPTIRPTITRVPDPTPIPTPTISASSTAVPTPQIIEYTIQSGDTIFRIAERNNVTVAEIQRLNPDIQDINRIATGQKIKIPAPPAR